MAWSNMAHHVAVRVMKSRDRLARNILVRRRELGISQEELGARADVSRRHMSRIENSEFSTSLDTVDKLAEALDIDPAKLLSPPIS